MVDPTPSDYRDTRLCAAYLAHDLLETAGVAVGDVIRVSTKRGRIALARVVGVHPSPDHEHGIIRFDRFTRQTLKAYPHEQVRIDRAELDPTPQVTLIPAV